MTVKNNKTLIQRFSGKTGTNKLIECLARQQLMGGNASLCQEIAKAGELLEFNKGKTVIRQGGSDDDLFLIISGSVRIEVNGREIASRHAEQHFGEMALIDPTARRSSTVVTKEKSTMLRISETDFSHIAVRYPELWRRAAVALAARLRERNKFHVAPHDVPVVFIGSSSESLDAAQAIAKFLQNKNLIVKLWTDGVFQASKTAIEDLWTAARDVDFSVIVLSPDDMCISRGKKARIPRDNAVFELGLFTGSLGRERSFVVTPDVTDLKIPTDLLGVTCLRFRTSGASTIGQRLVTPCRELLSTINSLGPR